MADASNSFLAILRNTERRQIMLDEAEYEILKQMREIRNTRRHCGLLIAYRDGKYTLSETKLIATFGVETK